MTLDELLLKAEAIYRKEDAMRLRTAWQSAVRSLIDTDTKALEVTGEVFSHSRLSRIVSWDKPGEDGRFYQLVQNVLVAYWAPFETRLREMIPDHAEIDADRQRLARERSASLR